MMDKMIPTIIRTSTRNSFLRRRSLFNLGQLDYQNPKYTAQPRAGVYFTSQN